MDEDQLMEDRQNLFKLERNAANFTDVNKIKQKFPGKQNACYT